MTSSIDLLNERLYLIQCAITLLLRKRAVIAFSIAPCYRFNWSRKPVSTPVRFAEEASNGLGSSGSIAQLHEYIGAGCLHELCDFCQGHSSQVSRIRSQRNPSHADAAEAEPR